MDSVTQVVLPDVVKLQHSRVLLTGFAAKHVGVEQARRVMTGLHMPVLYVKDVASPEASAFRPDLTIVYSTRPHYLASMLPALRRLPGLKALWHCDLRPPRLAPLIRGAFAGIFLPWRGRFNDARYGLGDCDTRAWQKLSAARVWYMPQAAELRPPLDVPVQRQVVFIGDLDLPCHRGRRELCELVRAHVMHGERGTKRRSRVARASPDLYASSRFSLTMSPPAEGYTSNRTFNILAWGGLALIQHYPECERLFVSGKHALVFRSSNQLQRQIARYGAEPKACASIRRAAWKLAAEKHTYVHRILNIAANVLGLDDSFWGYLDARAAARGV